MENEYWAIDSDEWWPVFSLYKRKYKGESDCFLKYKLPFEPSPQFLERYNRVVAEFNALQDELAEMQKTTEQYTKYGRDY